MQSVTSAIMHDNLIFTTPAWTFYKSSVIFFTLREWLGVNLSVPLRMLRLVFWCSGSADTVIRGRRMP